MQHGACISVQSPSGVELGDTSAGVKTEGPARGARARSGLGRDLWLFGAFCREDDAGLVDDDALPRFGTYGVVRSCVLFLWECRTRYVSYLGPGTRTALVIYTWNSGMPNMYALMPPVVSHGSTECNANLGGRHTAEQRVGAMTEERNTACCCVLGDACWSFMFRRPGWIERCTGHNSNHDDTFAHGISAGRGSYIALLRLQTFERLRIYTREDGIEAGPFSVSAMQRGSWTIRRVL